MKYDNEFLQTIYESNSLEEFLDLVDVEYIQDSRTRAIISTLKQSITSLHNELCPFQINSINNSEQKSNTPHES